MKFRHYRETIDFLFSQLPMYQRTGKAAYKANLDNTMELDRLHNHPHKQFKTIHVAGTNGKGSVSHLLASVCQEAGLKTGLYTSPHIVDFRERIKVNGNLIGEQDVIDFVNENFLHFENIRPSFFEMTVAMAFDYFKKQNVDIAIIEVGLGGRLDSTNIISPICSVITNIGNDHADLLGASVELRAIEKAGIIKPGIPVVIGETQQEIMDVFIEKAKVNNSEIFFADRNFSIDYSMNREDLFQAFNIKKSGKIYYEELKTPLFGKYQLKNSITVSQTLEVVEKDLKISRDAIYKGFENVLKNTGLRGRWEIISHNPLTICDTGHNEEGINEIIEQINQTAWKNLHFVFGAVNDKNISKILSLLPKSASYYFTKASIPRALDSAVILNLAGEFGLKGESFPDVISAYKTALKMAQKEDLVFVGGSTFVVADLIAYLEENR